MFPTTISDHYYRDMTTVLLVSVLKWVRYENNSNDNNNSLLTVMAIMYKVRQHGPTT